MPWVDGEWGEAEVGGAVEEQAPKFEIGYIDWSSSKGARHKTDSDTPHFYSQLQGEWGHSFNQRKDSEEIESYLLCFQTRLAYGIRRSRWQMSPTLGPVSSS